MHMRKSAGIIGSLLLAALLLGGCAGGEDPAEAEAELAALQDALEEVQGENKMLEEKVSTLEAALENRREEGPLSQALAVAGLLGDRDLQSLAAHVHPEKGVRFSPYAYVDLEKDRVLTAEAVAQAWQDPGVSIWGTLDGIGDPIEATFAEYFNRFVYDVEFASPHLIGNNVAIGTGNSLNNLREAYPEALFVEFHFTGFDPRFAGMDWRSLRLVFEETEAGWRLVGIIHDEWTI